MHAKVSIGLNIPALSTWPCMALMMSVCAFTSTIRSSTLAASPSSIAQADITLLHSLRYSKACGSRFMVTYRYIFYDTFDVHSKKTFYIYWHVIMCKYAYVQLFACINISDVLLTYAYIWESLHVCGSSVSVRVYICAFALLDERSLHYQRPQNEPSFALVNIGQGHLANISTNIISSMNSSEWLFVSIEMKSYKLLYKCLYLNVCMCMCAQYLSK